MQQPQGQFLKFSTDRSYDTKNTENLLRGSEVMIPKHVMHGPTLTVQKILMDGPDLDTPPVPIGLTEPITGADGKNKGPTEDPHLFRFFSEHSE